MLFQMVAGASLVGTVTALVLPSPDAITTQIPDVTVESDAIFPMPGVPVMLPDPDTTSLVSAFLCSGVLLLFPWKQ